MRLDGHETSQNIRNSGHLGEIVKQIQTRL